jgi:hypothetical protein
VNIDDERKTAKQRVDLFRSRFRESGEQFFPLQIALRWEQAVCAEPIDFDSMKEILDSAKIRQNEFDIVFFTFCNDMQSIIRQLWRASLNRET